MIYTCAFLFNPFMSQVLLAHKNHGPESCLGLWNGIGGRLKKGEHPSDCIRREIREETGIEADDLTGPFCTLSIGAGTSGMDDCDAMVHFYKCLTRIYEHPPENDAGEPLRKFDVRDLPDVAPHVNWLIPMALEREQRFCG